MRKKEEFRERQRYLKEQGLPLEEEDKEESEEDYEYDDYMPQIEYSTVCNADFAPLICNDFVTDYLDKDHGVCQIDRAEAIDLTRNFCFWLYK
jgi:hypothetical protein